MVRKCLWPMTAVLSAAEVFLFQFRISNVFGFSILRISDFPFWLRPQAPLSIHHSPFTIHHYSIVPGTMEYGLDCAE